MTGVSVEKFKEIVGSITPHWEESEHKRLGRPNRKRAIGAGRKFKLPTLHDKLLVLFIYFRTYISMDFLGYFFDLDRSNICRLIHYLQAAMKRVAVLPGDKPKRARSRRRKISNLKDYVDASIRVT